MASSTRVAPKDGEPHAGHADAAESSADKPKLDETKGDSDAKVDAPAVGGGGPTPLKSSKGKQKPTLVDFETAVAAFEKLAAQLQDTERPGPAPPARREHRRRQGFDPAPRLPQGAMMSDKALGDYRAAANKLVADWGSLGSRGSREFSTSRRERGR